MTADALGMDLAIMALALGLIFIQQMRVSALEARVLGEDHPQATGWRRLQHLTVAGVLVFCALTLWVLATSIEQRLGQP